MKLTRGYMSVILAMSCLVLGGCAAASEEPPPLPKTYAHAVTFIMTELQSGAPISGNIQATRQRDGNQFSGTFNQRIDLGETTNSEEVYSFSLNSPGYLAREIGQATITENTIKTNLINQVADIGGLLSECIHGINGSWVPRNITVRCGYNGNKRLSIDQINGIKDAVNFVKDNSLGYIQSITFDENANVSFGDMPNDGEIFAFSEDGAEVANTTFPQGGDRVNKGILYMGVRASGFRVRAETPDVFIQGEQDIDTTAAVGQYFGIMLNRPRGNDNSYRIGTDKETQIGLDSISMTTSTSPQASSD